MSPHPSLPTFSDVTAAAATLAGHAVRTPLLVSQALERLTGACVRLKPETLQHVGAFKFRGAFNRISMTERARHPGGVVACSSGNHAQGVAAAAALLGHASAVVMPSDAPAQKIARTRHLGAEVVLYDRVGEDREAIARNLAERRNADFIHPFDDAAIVAGQGTVGLELAADAAAAGLELDDVLVPCSGGGLAAGVALAVTHLMPKARITIVEPFGFDDFRRSLASGTRESNANAVGSVADALMAPMPGVVPFEIGRRLFAGATTVTDDEIALAMRFAFEQLKLVVEPGGAVALAALLSGRIETKGRRIGVVLSGGNVDLETFHRLVARSGRDTTAIDKTGGL